MKLDFNVNGSDKKSHIRSEVKPKVKHKRMLKSRLLDILDDLSSRLIRDGILNCKVKRAIYDNTVTEEARDYDEKFFKYSGFDKCLRDEGKLNRCYCAKCLMEEMLSLDMIAEDSDFVTDIHGNRLKPVCRHMHDPIVMKRDNRYYLLIRSKVPGFNEFYPIVDILKDFY